MPSNAAQIKILIQSKVNDNTQMRILINNLQNKIQMNDEEVVVLRGIHEDYFEYESDKTNNNSNSYNMGSNKSVTHNNNAHRESIITTENVTLQPNNKLTEPIWGGQLGRVLGSSGAQHPLGAPGAQRPLGAARQANPDESASSQYYHQ